MLKLFLCLFIGSNCWALALRGTLYSDQSGPSARGTGEVALATNGRIFELHYQKPLKTSFLGHGCFDPGAIWSIDARQLAPSSFELLSAKCSGNIDESVHASWRLVARFLELLQSDTSAALKLVSHDSTGDSYLTDKLVALNLEQYAKFGRQGRCLAVVSKPGAQAVEIEAGDDCFLSRGDRPVSVRFTISVDMRTGRRVISKYRSE